MPNTEGSMQFVTSSYSLPIYESAYLSVLPSVTRVERRGNCAGALG